MAHLGRDDYELGDGDGLREEERELWLGDLRVARHPDGFTITVYDDSWSLTQITDHQAKLLSDYLLTR